MKNSIFDSSRFFPLVKREIILNYKPFLIVFASIVGALTLGLVINQYFAPPKTNNFTTESLISSLGFLLIIWASISFHEIALTPGRQHYLSIPASHFEKVASKWLVISILIPLLLIIGFILYSYIIVPPLNLIGNFKVPSPSYDFDTLSRSYLSLIVFQSIFYFGSITWPKFSIFKTGFSIFLVTIVIGLIALLFVRVFFNQYFENGVIISNDLSFRFDPMEIVNIPYFGSIIMFVTWIFFMTVTYFKLKEKEL